MPDGRFPFSSCHLRKPVLCCGVFAYGDRLPVAAGKRLFAFAVSLLVCEFTGMMVGIAVTDASLHEKTADFDFFDYEADETKPVD